MEGEKSLGSTTLKIAIIAEHVHHRGGQERVVAEIITRLSRRHQIDLFCFSATDIPAENVRVHRLWCPGQSSTLQAIWMVMLSLFVIRPRRYDVILSQGGNCLVQNFVLVHTCHARRAQALKDVRWQYEKTSVVTRLLWGLRQAWATWMEGRAVRRCRGRVIAVSQVLADYVATQHGLKPSEVYTVPNGVDHSVFNPQVTKQLRSQVREAHGLSSEQFIILFAGGRWFDKGLPFVIEALQLMTQPATLMVVGDGDVELFTQLAEAGNSREKVIFIPPQQQISRYYAAADCLALPTRAEGFGLVMVEAAACGLPLVVTADGAATELVEDGVSGFLVNYAPAVIAEKLDILAASPELRGRMGQAAHQKSLKLSWDQQAEQIEQIFLSKRPEPSKRQVTIRLREGLQAARDRQVVKVAAISHSCVVDMNQQLYVELAQYDDVELQLIIPRCWWASLSGPITTSVLPELDDVVGTLPVRLPGQINLHWYPRQLHHTLQDFGPDILYVDEEPYSIAGAQGAYLANRLGCKLIVSTKENLVRSYAPPLGWTYKWVLGQADHILVVGKEGEEVLRRRGYEGPITVLPHGIDPQAFHPDRSTGQHLRERLGLTGAVIGYVGRLAKEKGVMDLVAAVKSAREEHNLDLGLLLIGEGQMRHPIEQAAREFLGPSKVVITGHIPHYQVPEYMNALDILVLPSRTTARWKEQFGRVLIEALACEVPVIGSDSGHIPYLIEDTGGGLVFREGDGADLAEKIQQLVENPGKAQALAREGRQRVLEKYTWSQTARQLHQVLRQVATGQDTYQT